MKYLPLYLVAISLFLSTQSQAESINETLSMDQQGFVSIELLNGSAKITGWDKNEFHIEGEINEYAEGFALEENNGNISFEEQYEENSGWSCWFGRNCSYNRGNNTKSNYEIFIPHQSKLNFEGINASVDVSQLQQDTDIETINGPVTIFDVTGHVSVETVNGSIELSDINGRLDASTVNGRIELKNSILDRANFETVNGRIEVDVNAARIEAETVNGTIDIKSLAMDELEASTLNGDISFEISLNEDANIEISSFNGSIELSVPEDTSARYEIETKGRIRNKISDVQPDKTSRYSDAKELTFIIGSGSSNVEISSYSGDVRLESR